MTKCQKWKLKQQFIVLSAQIKQRQIEINLIIAIMIVFKKHAVTVAILRPQLVFKSKLKMRFQYLNEDKLVVNIRTQKIGYITGTMVTVDVQKRLIKMEVDDNEDQQRQQNWHPQKPQFEVGYG